MLGHPIIGDRHYWFTNGGRNAAKNHSDYALPSGQMQSVIPSRKEKRMYLCSVNLTFTHPVTGELINVNRPEPENFRHFRNEL